MRALLIAALIASFAPAAAQAQAPAQTPPQPYTTAQTTIGDLMADPAANAVLVKHLPEIVDGGLPKGMTFRELQKITPDLFSDKVLADIDADLAKLPKK